MNRILRDEKEKLEQLIVKKDGKAVEKGEFTKQFNSIFGNTLLGVVDAWYYRILQLNIYDLLLSLHDRKEINYTKLGGSCQEKMVKNFKYNIRLTYF